MTHVIRRGGAFAFLIGAGLLCGCVAAAELVPAPTQLETSIEVTTDPVGQTIDDVVTTVDETLSGEGRDPDPSDPQERDPDGGGEPTSTDPSSDADGPTPSSDPDAATNDSGTAPDTDTGSTSTPGGMEDLGDDAGQGDAETETGSDTEKASPLPFLLVPLAVLAALAVTAFLLARRA